MRKTGTNVVGSPFNKPEIDAVWMKGTVIPEFDSKMWRRDTFGSALRYGDYGKTDSQYGWEIDHIKPVAKGGSDILSNLQPLQWENNRNKGDNYPVTV